MKRINYYLVSIRLSSGKEVTIGFCTNEKLSYESLVRRIESVVHIYFSSDVEVLDFVKCRKNNFLFTSININWIF